MAGRLEWIWTPDNPGSGRRSEWRTIHSCRLSTTLLKGIRRIAESIYIVNDRDSAHANFSKTYYVDPSHGTWNYAPPSLSGMEWWSPRGDWDYEYREWSSGGDAIFVSNSLS